MSRREPVELSGILRGAGREASSTLHATKVSLPDSGAFAYTKHSIKTVSDTLPDGDYDLLVNGQTHRLILSKGHWLARAA